MHRCRFRIRPRCGSFISRRSKRLIRRCERSFTSCISITEWISGRRLILEPAGETPALQKKRANGERKILTDKAALQRRDDWSHRPWQDDVDGGDHQGIAE